MNTYSPYPLSLPPTQPPIPPILVITEHWAELPVRYTRFPPAIYLAHGTGHTSTLLSQFIPLSSSPAVSTCLFSHLHFYYCPANRFIYIIFLDFTYMCYYTIPVLLWVISFYMTSMSLQMTQFHSFSCLSNSPLCVCTTASLSLYKPE